MFERIFKYLFILPCLFCVCEHTRPDVTILVNTRGKKILEHNSRTRFFTGFENPALRPCYVAAEKGREI